MPGEKILIVDDEENIRLLYEQELSDDGYDVIRKERYARQLEMGLIDDTYSLSEATSWGGSDVS